MQGYRFYAEFPTATAKRKNLYAGSVVAVILDDRGKPFRGLDGKMDALAGVYEHSDSAVNLTSVHADYLRKRCKRVKEATARSIHPALFARLDN